jgi:3'(2'), 5'-bisphosphate nucleotidase
MLQPSAAHALPLDDGRLAAALAAGAGAVLMALRAQVDAARFAGPSLQAAGDAAAQAYLAAMLASARPRDVVLSEEVSAGPARLEAERVWIIDPLDGSREFAERSPDGSWRDDFSVHVALWQRGKGLTDGAVALPARGRVHGSVTPPALRCGPAAEVLAGRRRLRIAVSRSRPPELVARLSPGRAELVPMGSSGVKALAVADGTVDAYVHAGGQYEWDTAAPVAVATAAGLSATRLDGSPLRYNKTDPLSPDLLICPPGLVAFVRALLAPIAAGAREDGST